MSDYPELNVDFVDLIGELKANNVDVLVVGAHPLAAHGVVRATGDLDVFVRPCPDNAGRLVRAL